MTPLLGLSRASLRRLGALVLLLHVAGLGAPLAHAAAEARHGHEAGGAAATVETSCDPGCTAAGHSHHAHDSATCAACRALASPGAPARSTVLGDRVGTQSSVVAAVGGRALPGCSRRPASRGPPAILIG